MSEGGQLVCLKIIYSYRILWTLSKFIALIIRDSLLSPSSFSELRNKILQCYKP